MSEQPFNLIPILNNEGGLIIHYTPRWPLIIHYICAVICFGCSAVYHLFNSHSKKMMSFWIRFDYAGICFMIAGSSTSPIYYSFACEQLLAWRVFYLCFIWGISAVTCCVMLNPQFDRDDYNSVRGGLFMATGLSALIPIAHVLFAVDQQYIHHFHIEPWLIGGLFYIGGVFFYATYFPESCC